METNHKKYLHNWETAKKYKSQKNTDVSLETIINNVRSSQQRVAQFKDDVRPSGNQGIPDILANCHPWLYYNYIVSWRDISDNILPKGFNTGEEFGRSVIRDWQQECWKHKMFNSGMLSVYDTIDQLREESDHFLESNSDNGFFIQEGYSVHEQSLWEIRQAEIDAEQRKKDQEKERKEKERNLLIAENKVKEANQIADDLRRQLQHDQNQEQARQNREFLNQSNSPWSSSVVSKATSSQSTSDNTTAVHDASTEVQHKNPDFYDSDPFEQSAKIVGNDLQNLYDAYDELITGNTNSGKVELVISLKYRKEYGHKEYKIAVIGDKNQHHNQFSNRLQRLIEKSHEELNSILEQRRKEAERLAAEEARRKADEEAKRKEEDKKKLLDDMKKMKEQYEATMLAMQQKLASL